MMTPRELREACPPGGGPYACPCCRFLTLDARCAWDVCRECGWEDDGQDDLNADEVWGGPNGSESLTAARRGYAEYAAGARSGPAVGGPRRRWRVVERGPAGPARGR
ncbi:CPCC family cysteine-rich protein [Streptomyces sp. NBC_00853]|uniref:CPCC family cysteine-rich protein n=1 Tax=Streptomyces sp. NBC_00853 TaxID=2903681 RepID=UPI00387316C4